MRVPTLICKRTRTAFVLLQIILRNSLSGGGNLENTDLNLGRVPLLWMESEASNAGLHLEGQIRSRVWDWDKLQHETPIDSLDTTKSWAAYFWWFLEALPIKRSTYNLENPAETER